MPAIFGLDWIGSAKMDPCPTLLWTHWVRSRPTTGFLERCFLPRYAKNIDKNCIYYDKFYVCRCDRNILPFTLNNWNVKSHLTQLVTGNGINPV